jgi:hypothetical protein
VQLNRRRQAGKALADARSRVMEMGTANYDGFITGQNGGSFFWCIGQDSNLQPSDPK